MAKKKENPEEVRDYLLSYMEQLEISEEYNINFVYGGYYYLYFMYRKDNKGNQCDQSNLMTQNEMKCFLDGYRRAKEKPFPRRLGAAKKQAIIDFLRKNVSENPIVWRSEPIPNNHSLSSELCDWISANGCIHVYPK